MWCEVHQVIRQAPWLRPDRPAADLLPVGEQDVARISRQPRGHTIGNTVEMEGSAEQAVSLGASRGGGSRRPTLRFCRLLGHPDPVAPPANFGEIVRGH